MSKGVAVAKQAADMLCNLVNKMPDKEARSSALSITMMISYKLLRTMEGDEFVRGFLESCLREVNETPPDICLAVKH